MPSFCRHNHLIQNCAICSREQSVEMRPVVSPGTPKSSGARAAGPGPRQTEVAGSRARAAAAHSHRGGGSRAGGGLRVRHLERGVEDGYRSPLVPGLKSSQDAERLAAELAFATARLIVLEQDPPGLFAEVVAPDQDLEERTWLAFLIAYLSPLDDQHPFAAIEAVRTSWASGEVPELDDVQTGPRSGHERSHGGSTVEAYRAWAARAGSQQAAFTGEGFWTPERRFARAFERLALPGMHRDTRFDLLVTLGRLGCYDLRAGALEFGGENETTLAAKRALGIGDPLLLERRAAELAHACGVPLEALDLALNNWGAGHRSGLGLPADTEPDADALITARAGLGL